MKLHKIPVNISSINLVCMLYAIYGIRDVGLVIANQNYSPLVQGGLRAVPFIVVVASIYYFFNHSILLMDKAHGYLLLLPSILAMMSLYSYTETYKYLLYALPMIFFLLMRIEDRIRIFDYFYWIIQISNVIAICLFFCYIFSIDIGWELIPRYNAKSPAVYAMWSVFAIDKMPYGGRLCSIFMEPGPLGTLCAFFYIIKSEYCKRWERVLLVLTIFCTFSFSGVLLLFCYLALYKLKYGMKYVVIPLTCIFVFISIPYIDWGNEQLNVFCSRFKIVDGRLSGDNRTNALFDEKYREFLSNGPVWFGYGRGYEFQGDVIHASYKQMIVEYGFWGFSILMIMWLTCSLKLANRNVDCIFCVLFFMISLYGRPRQMMEIWGYILLFGGIEWIQWQALRKSMQTV